MGAKMGAHLEDKRNQPPRGVCRNAADAPSGIAHDIAPDKSTDARDGGSPATSIGADKATLRRLVLARRDALDVQTRAQKSARICDELAREVLGMDRYGVGTELPAEPRPTVAIYAAFGSEADPSAFAQAAELAGWRVAYPCMLPRETGAARGRAGHAEIDVRAGDRPIDQRMYMRAVAWDDRAGCPFLRHPTHTFSEHDIDATRFPVVTANELDAIVVPLVAFDACGMRLGYGGGCYDRYLPTVSATCKVLGIAFAEQEVEAVPADEHDLPLPRIISA